MGYDNGQNDEGRAYVYHGSLTGLSTTPDWTAESDLASSQLGASAPGAVMVSDTQVGTGCSAFDNGSVRLRSGRDDGSPSGTARNGQLEAGEVDASFVCLDFEALEALDLELLDDHLGRPLAGEEVTTARFDFHGERPQGVLAEAALDLERPRDFGEPGALAGHFCVEAARLCRPRDPSHHQRYR